MYKALESKYINAGENVFYRYGHKAQAKLAAHLEPNSNGFYSIPADGGKYWSFGTSDGKFGEYAKFDGNFLSVNKMGNIWAKVGTEKADIFVRMVNGMIEAMKDRDAQRIADLDRDEDED